MGIHEETATVQENASRYAHTIEISPTDPRQATTRRILRRTSHDINNLLFAAKGRADLLSEGPVGQSEDLSFLKESLDGLSTFAQRLGQAAGMQRAALLDESAFVPVALGTVARDMESDKAQIQVESADDVLTVAIPLDVLCLFLVELTRNAVLAGSTKIVLSAVAAGAFVEFAVTDNGAGMSPETMELAVEPFSNPKSGRLGLGLNRLAALLSDAGQGMIISSTEGEGTRVAFRLPVEADMEASS